MDIDTDKLDDAALAILSLTLHDGRRVWKNLDWAITDRLFQKGLIDDPKGKSKSMVLTDADLERAETVRGELFAKTEARSPE